eukprot:6889444-Prymnesium_polylepis.1
MPVGGNFAGRQVTRPPRGAATAWGHGATGDEVDNRIENGRRDAHHHSAAVHNVSLALGK